MHTYLEAAGFSGICSRNDMERLIGSTILHYDEKHIFRDGSGRLMAEFSREYAPGIGLTVCGELGENNDFHEEYSFPYLRSSVLGSREELMFEKHGEKESYAGACDDPRVGVTVIFYLRNMGQFMKAGGPEEPGNARCPVRFSGLAREGCILLPVFKTPAWEKESRKRSAEHTRLVSAARFGDEEAMESLTVEDVDLCSMISERVQGEDVLSIVDTSFMPYGMECDQYSIIGTIASCEKVYNIYTGEEIWEMELSVCDITMDVCIHAERLMGEPRAGRRFRGVIWLQGEGCFPPGKDMV